MIDIHFISTFLLGISGLLWITTDIKSHKLSLYFLWRKSKVQGNSKIFRKAKPSQAKPSQAKPSQAKASQAWVMETDAATTVRFSFQSHVFLSWSRGSETKWSVSISYEQCTWSWVEVLVYSPRPFFIIWSRLSIFQRCFMVTWRTYLELNTLSILFHVNCLSFWLPSVKQGVKVLNWNLLIAMLEFCWVSLLKDASNAFSNT